MKFLCRLDLAFSEGSTWKGVEKPGGAEYFAPALLYRYLPDCPVCRYGTLDRLEGRWVCADCGAVTAATHLAGPPTAA
jgi:hypothetical protein